MKRTNGWMAAFSAVMVWNCLQAGAAGLGTSFTYQGRLTQDGGVTNTTYDLQFSLFDEPIGGAQQGPTLCFDNVTLTGEVFTVQLDFGNQFTGQQRFLNIDVRADAGLDCGSPAGFIALSPRQALTAVPNALFALNAESSDSFRLPFSGSVADPVMAFSVNNTGPGLAIFGSAETTGVSGSATGASGTTSGGSFVSSSTSGRGVFGSATAASGITYGVYGQTASSVGRAVFGSATASASTRNYGGWFQSSGGTGIGVFGWATAASGSGTNYGVYGLSDGTSARGVQGEASAGSGRTYGLYGSSASTEGRGVFGTATATTGTTYGGRFESTSVTGRGVLGLATAGSGNTYGVMGQSDSTSGVGVYGLANALGAETTYGVYGLSTGPAGRGVYGSADAASGATYGGYFRNLSSEGIGVYAYAQPGQPAVVADHVLKIGSSLRDGMAMVYGASSAQPVLIASAAEHGGYLRVFDKDGHGVAEVKPSDNHSGGYLRVDRAAGVPGFVVNGNTGTEQPMVSITGSGLSATFDMRPSLAPDDTVVLPESSIRSKEIGDEPGVASAFRALSSMDELTTLVTRAIVAPGPGYVLAIATATAGVNHGVVGGSWARFGLAYTNVILYRVDVGVDATLPAGEFRFPVAVHGLFPVSAGPNEISFVAQEMSSAWQASDISLTLTYVPTAYGQVQTPLTKGDSMSPSPATAARVANSNLEPRKALVAGADQAGLEQELADVKSRLSRLESWLLKSGQN